MKLKDKIAYLLPSFVKTTAYDLVIPNFFLGLFEADLFMLTKSGVLYEYEIKTSRADYKKDFEKRNKHDDIRTGNRCNKFFFVVPEGLITIEECPDYAGLIYLGEKIETFTVVKPAKMLTKNKFPIQYEHLAKSLSFREGIWKGKVRYSKYQIQRLNEYIDKLLATVPKDNLLRFARPQIK